MKELFEFIQLKINTNIPAIKTVRMWNNQFKHSNTNTGAEKGSKSAIGRRDERAFRYPAVFVEFIVVEVHNLPLGIKDYILTIRFRFGRESYKFERLETFDFCDNFYSYIHMLGPGQTSPLIFTTLQEITTEFDEDHNNVESPYIDYRTRYRSQVAYARRNDILVGPIEPIVTRDLVNIFDDTFDDSFQ